MNHKKHIIFCKTHLLFWVMCFLLIGCKKDEITTLPIETLAVPRGFPAIDFPADNSYSDARWQLGKKLFFDPVLSRDSSLSCASCHKPALAFADDVALSPGVENRPGVRNAPTLTNVAYQPYLLREGGVPTIEMQVLVPIQEHNEFDNNIVDIAEKLAKNELYTKMSLNAYGRMPDAFIITRSIATFERSILSGNSKYDQWKNGNNTALNAAEKRGKDLFFSEKTNCSACHGSFNFTEYAFENNGLYTDYNDLGRMRFTNNEVDRAKFKVPTLRNVTHTAPYMFDGSLVTLEDVINHYNSGGKAHKNKSALVKPLHLSQSEKDDLLAFLKSLTDEEFITNNKWNL